tara:strand:+ start:169 stop:639 length:471 start_codon:yes stop_codon:yes gene_type:complete
MLSNWFSVIKDEENLSDYQRYERDAKNPKYPRLDYTQNADYHYYIKPEIWKEAGLKQMDGNPSIQEFEKELGRKTTIDDHDDIIYPIKSYVYQTWGEEEASKKADNVIESFIEDKGVDIKYWFTLIDNGPEFFGWYVKYYPNGKYAEEIKRQLEEI